MLALGKDKKGRNAGEDFFYITSMRNASGTALGVADGVGGWVNSGVDPSLFAQSLMYHAHLHSHESWPSEPESDPTQEHDSSPQVEGLELTPHRCLDLAYNGVLQDKLVSVGSSTACLITLNAASGVLRAANLGDSGFLIIRSSSVLYKQPAQTHSFNCPLQLTKIPLDQYNNHYLDLPSAAAQYERRLRDGDILVAYTDGLSDNVYPAEIAAVCSLVSRSRFHDPEDAKVQAMADALVRYTHTCMYDRKRVSPFAREAGREGLFRRGGKVDDVTVVMVLVRETP